MMDNEIERIVFHCSDLLNPHFFEGNSAFKKDDKRMISMKMNIETPSYEFLEKIVDRFLRAEFIS